MRALRIAIAGISWVIMTVAAALPGGAQTNPVPSPQGVPNPTVTPRGDIGPVGSQTFTGPAAPPLRPDTAFVLGTFPTIPASVSGFGQPLLGAQGTITPSLSAPASNLGMPGVGRGLPGMPAGPPLDEPMGAAAGGCPYC